MATVEYAAPLCPVMVIILEKINSVLGTALCRCLPLAIKITWTYLLALHLGDEASIPTDLCPLKDQLVLVP